jgi:hypothetical protein
MSALAILMCCANSLPLSAVRAWAQGANDLSNNTMAWEALSAVLRTILAIKVRRDLRSTKRSVLADVITDDGIQLPNTETSAVIHNR